MNDDKRIIDIICDSLLPLAFLLLVIICIVCCFTLPVHAAGEQDYFPMQQNNNSKFSADLISSIESRFDTENNNVFVYFVNFNPSQGYGRYNYYFVTFPKSSEGMMYGEKYNNLYEWSIYFYGSVTYNQGSFWCDARQPNVIASVSNGGNNSAAWFQGLQSSNYNSSIDYVSNFKIYTNNNPATRKVVLLYGADDDPFIADGDTIPEDTEKPKLNDYLPDDTTPPTFDNSSVEAALGSIFDYLQYETNKISGTISGIGEYLSDSIMWGLQMVINNIRNKISEMVQAIGDKIDEVKVGIGSIIDNIEDFVDYIKEPVDKQAIETALEGTTLYSVSSIGSSITNIFSDYFDSIPQPDTLVFTVPYTILSKSGNVVVDFSWYADIRSTVLPWIVGFLYAGFAFAIFRSIPSIIHGVSGVLQKGG